jgi:hypothetical protein
MKIELNEDELTLIVRALYQYHAYLISQKREDRRYVDLAEHLEVEGREARKPPASQKRPEFSFTGQEVNHHALPLPAFVLSAQLRTRTSGAARRHVLHPGE